MNKDNKNEVQELMKWWGVHSQKIINIKSKNHSFDLKILKTRLPHLLGLHYMKKNPKNVTGIDLLNEIYDKNLKNKDIFKNIKANQSDLVLFKVKNRILNFKNFMENLENAEIVENTSKNMNKIKYFIIAPNKNNNYFMLGIGNNGKENYIGTFILDSDRYFKGSKIEKVEKIYRYKHSKSKEKIAFSFDNKKLENERNKILQKVRQNGWELEKLDIGYSNDKEIMLEAVKQDGMVLSIVKDNFQKDKETVLTAVKNNGMQLAFANEELRKDREIVLEAVKENGLALEFADKTLKEDAQILFEAILQNPDVVDKYSIEKIVDNKAETKSEKLDIKER